MVNKNQATIIAAGLIVLIATVAIVTVLTFQYPISSTGSIRTIGCQVYGNEELTTLINAIDWGSINVGGHSDATVWVKNNGTAPITLTLSTNSYVPANTQSYLTLTWTYSNQTIQPNNALPIDLTLNVSPATIGITVFSLNIVITGTG
jgi:hypothetical protein